MKKTLLGYAMPTSYNWLLEQQLVGYKAFTNLQPWHYFPDEHCFLTKSEWPKVVASNLLVFAKRQDCDDMAGFVVADGKLTGEVQLIHGWCGNGFEVMKAGLTFWTWLQLVIEDIQFCVESVPSP
jgi:hypothetical protein